jgi:hypothetical protein
MQIQRKYLEVAAKDRGKKALKGWKFLGEGSERRAFLGPDGLVYKMAKYGENYQSPREVVKVWELRGQEIPEWLFIPRSYYSAEFNVTVMEYAEGDKPSSDCDYRCVCDNETCWRKRAKWIKDNLGLIDVHGDNVVILEDGRLALVDLGI